MSELSLRATIAVPGAVRDLAVSRGAGLPLRCVAALPATSSICEYDLPSLAVTAHAQLPSPPSHVLFLEGAHAVVAITTDAAFAVFVRTASNPLHPLTLVSLPGAVSADRAVALAVASPTRPLVAFVKQGSPSVWCATLNPTTSVAADAVDFFKLRSDIEGDQARGVGLVRTGLATVRGQLSSKKADKVSPVVALEIHRRRPLIAAAFLNGILRVWDFDQKLIRAEMDVQLLAGESVASIAFHPREEILLAATDNGRIASFRFRGVVHARGNPPRVPSSKFAAKVNVRDLAFWDPRDNAHADRAPAGDHAPYVLVLTAQDNVLLHKVDSLTAKVFRSTVYPRGLKLPVQNAFKSKHVRFSVEQTTGLVVLFDSFAGHASVFEQVDSYGPASTVSTTRAPGVVAGVQTPFSSDPGEALEGPVDVHPHAIFQAGSSMFLYRLFDNAVLEIGRNLPSGRTRHISVAYDSDNGEMMAAIVCLYAEDMDVDSNAGNAASAAYIKDENWKWRYVLLTRKGDTTDAERWSVSDLQDGRDAFFLGLPGAQNSVLILSPTGTSVAVVSFGKQAQSRGVQRIKFHPDYVVRRVFGTPMGDGRAVFYWVESKNLLCLSRGALLPNGTESDLELDLETAAALNPEEVVLDVRWQHMPSGSSNRRADVLGFALTTRRVLLFRNDLEPLAQCSILTHVRSELAMIPPTALWMGPSVLLCIGSSLFSVTMDGEIELLCRLAQSSSAAVLVAALPDRVVYLKYPSAIGKEFSLVVRPIGSLSLLVRGLLALPTTRGGVAYAGKIKSIIETRDARHVSVGFLRSLVTAGLSPLARGVLRDKTNSYAPMQSASLLTELDDLQTALKVLENEYRQLPSEDDFFPGSELYRSFQTLCNHAFSVNDFQIASRCAHVLGREGTLRAFVDREGGFEALRVLTDFASRSTNQQVAQRLAYLQSRSEKSSVAVLDLMAALPANTAPEQIAEGMQPGSVDGGEVYVAERGDRVRLSPLELRDVEDRIGVSHHEDFVKLRGDEEIAQAAYRAEPESEATAALTDSGNAPIVEAIEYDDANESETRRREDGGEDFRGGPHSTTSALQVLRSDMQNVFQLIDNRELAEAESVLDSCVSLLPEVEDAKPLQVVIHYIFFVRLLAYIIKGKANLTKAAGSGNVNPMQVAAARARLAHLGTSLTDVPFIIDRHKVRAVLLVIGLHMEVGNFGTAARGIQMVQGNAPADRISDLQRAMATCTAQAFVDQTPQLPGSWTCFQSLTVTTEAPVGCSTCEARYSPSVVSSQMGGLGSRCPYCRMGVVG